MRPQTFLLGSRRSLPPLASHLGKPNSRPTMSTRALTPLVESSSSRTFTLRPRLMKLAALMHSAMRPPRPPPLRSPRTAIRLCRRSTSRWESPGPSRSGVHSVRASLRQRTPKRSQVDALFSKGKSDLSEWYQRYEEQKGKTRSTNREAERAFVAERDEVIPGGEWERIARLVDFNPKGTKNSKDTSRLRSILLQLKQTPLVR
eukprot:Opistho-2@36740